MNFSEYTEVNDYNDIQYSIPAFTDLVLMIQHYGNAFINILEGTADLDKLGQTIHLRSGQEFLLWPTIQLPLSSTSGCSFRIRGIHDVYEASTREGEQIFNNLFVVICHGCTFEFILKKGIQLHIFVGDPSDVTLTLIHGASEVFGRSLAIHKEYKLPPYSSFLVDNFTTGSCKLRIKGTNRKIKVSALKETTWELVRNVNARIDGYRRQAMENRCIGPNILVVGPRNVGKTSFCHFLLNKAIENEMQTIHIDLDVCGNSNTIPGTMHLCEIEGRLNDAAGGFRGKEKSFLFGYINPKSHLVYYYLLIKMISCLFKVIKMKNITKFSSATVEMCGSLAEDQSEKDFEIIDFVIRTFKIDILVVIGSRGYYDSILQNSFIKGTELHFILASDNIEQLNPRLEAKIRDNKISKYFYGTKIWSRPRNLNILEVNMHQIQIYRVIPKAHASNKNYDFLRIGVDDVGVVPVKCDGEILAHVLGVSNEVRADENLPVAPIKYFVHVKNVDMEKGILTVVSPITEPLSGAILMMGDRPLYRVCETKIYIDERN